MSSARPRVAYTRAPSGEVATVADAPLSAALPATALDHLTARSDKLREAYEDIIWALVNAKEFQFND